MTTRSSPAPPQGSGEGAYCREETLFVGKNKNSFEECGWDGSRRLEAERASQRRQGSCERVAAVAGGQVAFELGGADVMLLGVEAG